MSQLKTPLITQIKNAVSKNNIRLHMPGHKGFSKVNQAWELLGEDVWNADFTEIAGLDNLQQPQECIKEAQELAASYFGANKTYFLVNGTTVGILATLTAIKNCCSKIAVPRFAHKAVFNGIIIAGLEAVFVPPTINDEWQIPLGVSLQDWSISMEQSISGILTTNSNYYGFVEDLKQLRKLGNDKILIIDEAHGSHFHASSLLPTGGIQAGADMVIQSIHKTFGSLTQTSLLHINNEDYFQSIENALKLLQTTSPSYVLMASIDGARRHWAINGSIWIEELIEKISNFREKLRFIQGITIVDEELLMDNSIYYHDYTKIIVSARDLGLSGGQLAQVLREDYNIEVEMNDFLSVVLLFSIGDLGIDWEKILKAFESISKAYRNSNPIKVDRFSLPKFSEAKITMREAYFNKKRVVPLENSEGYLAGEMLVPYPPGVPVILPGELITYEHVLYLKEILQTRHTCLGISTNRQIQIVDK